MSILMSFAICAGHFLCCPGSFRFGIYDTDLCFSPPPGYFGGLKGD
jgi:hypothetical protein